MNEQSQDNLDEIERITLSHYEANAASFWLSTRDHDVSQNIGAILNALPKNRALDILDFGCGPGRDLLTFKQLGHRPIGLDGSQAFCGQGNDASAYCANRSQIGGEWHSARHSQRSSPQRGIRFAHAVAIRWSNAPPVRVLIEGRHSGAFPSIRNVAESGPLRRDALKQNDFLPCWFGAPALSSPPTQRSGLR